MRARLLPAFLITTGCLRSDPDHCANRAGDQTCAEFGAGEFCSACASAHNGCVEDPPPPSCAAQAPADGQSTTSSSSSDGTGDSAGPPCEGSAATDECPDLQPYCVEGRCASCSSGFSCDTLPDAPVCIDAWGNCVQCSPSLENDTCPETSWCGNDFQCGGCTRHDQCPDSACDLSSGTCMPTDLVLYVDKTACSPNSRGDGTTRAPLCAIQDAIDAIGTGERGTIFVTADPTDASSYDALDLTTTVRTVAIRGVGNPVIGRFGPHSIDVGSFSTLYLSDLTVWLGERAALNCSTGSRVSLEDVTVRQGQQHGIHGRDCDIEVVRSQIHSNAGAAFLVEDGSYLRLEASAVFNNNNDRKLPENTTAIRAQNSTFDLLYSTLIGGPKSPDPQSQAPMHTLICEGETSSSIRNSVVASPSLDSISCLQLDVQTSFVDTLGVGGDGVFTTQEWNETWFTNLSGNDIRIRDPLSSPFGDVARWTLGDPQLDFERTPRTAAFPGSPGFAGADEPE